MICLHPSCNPFAGKKGPKSDSDSVVDALIASRNAAIASAVSRGDFAAASRFAAAPLSADDGLGLGIPSPERSGNLRRAGEDLILLADAIEGGDRDGTIDACKSIVRGGYVRMIGGTKTAPSADVSLFFKIAGYEIPDERNENDDHPVLEMGAD